MGFKDFFLWLQAVPVDEENCKARIVIQYEISMIGRTLGLEESYSPEVLKSSLDKYVSELKVRVEDIVKERV